MASDHGRIQVMLAYFCAGLLLVMVLVVANNIPHAAEFFGLCTLAAGLGWIVWLFAMIWEDGFL